MFTIFTGLPCRDILSLRKSDLKKENGEYLLMAVRIKTKERIQQILIKQAVEIIEKYKQHPETLPFDNILPKKDLHTVNKNLKLVQAKAGLETNLTTHLGRHTACQFLTDLGSINNDIINVMPGWSNGREGSRTVYRIPGREVLLDAKNKYQTFINNLLCKR